MAAALTGFMEDGSAEFRNATMRTFAANDRMHRIVIEHLDPRVWTARPPGNVRTIAAVFTHVHNVRCKWVRLTAPQVGVPKQLQRSHCTQQQALQGLAESATACCAMLAEAKEFRRDALTQVWPSGVEMLCYMISHEAHHRGQVCLVAHQ